MILENQSTKDEEIRKIFNDVFTSYIYYRIGIIDAALPQFISKFNKIAQLGQEGGSSNCKYIRDNFLMCVEVSTFEFAYYASLFQFKHLERKERIRKVLQTIANYFFDEMRPSFYNYQRKKDKLLMYDLFTQKDFLREMQNQLPNPIYFFK